MNAAPQLEDAEAEEPEDENEEEPVGGVSFFAEPGNEAVDQVVALRVWNIFARESREAGIPCSPKDALSSMRAISSRRQDEGAVLQLPSPLKAKSVAPPPPRNIEEKNMKKRGEMLRLVADAKAAFESVHGKAPSARELFDAMGPALGKSVGNVGMSLKRIANGTPNKTKPAKPAAVVPAQAKARRAVAPAKAAPVVAVKASRTTSTDPTIAALIVKRDALRTKADAIDVAIDALSVEV